MARRPKEEEHENHERWLVSYADFITLLFAFFVVMYALSSLNEGKYRVMSESIKSAFVVSEPGAIVGQNVPIVPPTIVLPPVPPKPKGNAKAEAEQAQKKQKMKDVAKELRSALAPLVEQGKVKVTDGALGITVDINASVLFAPGDARLDIIAQRALIAVAQIIAVTEFPIVVEGHTDNTPINTPLFPSNWELSGVRAASVVRLFIDAGVAPARLSAVGYADQRPVADNATPDGRQANRRVAINLESKVPDNAVEVPIQ